MTYSCLREFIDELERRKLLVRITESVDTHLEITEIHRRVLLEKGPALLFENIISNGVKSHYNVLSNLFGTIERIALAFGTTESGLRDIGHKLAFLRHPEPPSSWREALKMAPLMKDLLAMKPQKVTKGVCQEIIWQGEEVDLTKLPIQTCWPNEPAPLMTWPLVVTKSNANLEDYNLGIYRMQVIGKNKTLMRWLKHRGGAEHHRRWQKEQKKIDKMPVAIVIGCDPATILAAVTPVPENISEYDFSGLIRRKKLQLVRCKTIPIDVPANAEIILEGHVSLAEYGDEGPYGDHTGYYNSMEKFPVFTVQAVTMRKNPIYLSTFTGRPPDEPSVLGEALNEVFIPILQQQFPEIIDFWLPPEGCSYRVAVVSIKKSYPGHAKRIMMGIWSYLRQFTYTKFIIVTDSDINVRNWEDVIWAISTRMDFKRDVVVIDNTPIDYLDFATPQSELGAKMGFDATNKIYPETTREWGKKIEMDPEIIEMVTKKWESYWK